MGFFVHAGIDGHFRLPVYLCRPTNSKANTLLELFLKAVFSHGLIRVQNNKGREIIDVASYMLTGSSKLLLPTALFRAAVAERVLKIEHQSTFRSKTIAEMRNKSFLDEKEKLEE